MILAAGLATTANAADGEWAQVGEALGKAGTELPGGVYRVGLPRTDLKVTLDGVELKAGFALGGWLAFEKMGDDGMVMGDLVLTMDEVNPVMTKLDAGGIEITALHNHLLRNQPFTMYMHVLGHGDPVKLAGDAARRRWPKARRRSRPPPQPAPARRRRSISTPRRSTRRSAPRASNNGGVYQFGIPRAEPIKDGGMEVPPAMGSAIAINFQPTGGGKAAITGDFVLIAKEVNPVLKALRDNGIEVTALHNHMLDDQPRLFFMHFWANDDAQKLAQGLKAALAHDQHRQELSMLARAMLLAGWQAVGPPRLVARDGGRAGTARHSRRRSRSARSAAGSTISPSIRSGSGCLSPSSATTAWAWSIWQRARCCARSTVSSEPQGVGLRAGADSVYVANAGDGSVRLLRGEDFAPIGQHRARRRRRQCADRSERIGGAGRLRQGRPRGDRSGEPDARPATSALTAHPEGFQLDRRRHASSSSMCRTRSEIGIADLAGGRRPIRCRPGRWREFSDGDRPRTHGRFSSSFAARRCLMASRSRTDSSSPRLRPAAMPMMCSSTPSASGFTSAAAQGFVDVLDGSEEAAIARLARVPTVSGARTSLFVPELDRLYVAVRAGASEPAAIWVFRPMP